jgi:hypothetical protein
MTSKTLRLNCAVCGDRYFVPAYRLSLMDRYRLWVQTGHAPWTKLKDPMDVDA